MRNHLILFLFSTLAIFMSFCKSTKEENSTETETMEFTGAKGEVKIITLDPGHFHAALVQKSMYDQVNPKVFVYAPEGSDVKDHLTKIEAYNKRAENPTQWEEEIYTGPDFFEKMIEEKQGNVVVLSGNNKKKTEYIKASVQAGLNVLADKPMAINSEDFNSLKEAFAIADSNDVLLYDIMTERHEITTMLQKEFSLVKDIFGELQQGTPDDPAVTKESVHHFFKYVSGNPIKRPDWFFDVTQQGEGIVDVTTHLVDLVQWESFPDQIIDYKTDIEILKARRWATNLSPSQFKKVTTYDEYPDFLKSIVKNDSILEVYANGEIIYKIKGIHAKVSVIWNFEAPEGAGDTHFSIMKGTKSNLIIKQGKEQNYKPELYIEPVLETDLSAFEEALNKSIENLQNKYMGVGITKEGEIWKVSIPETFRNGHEAHFAQVTEKFLQYLIDGKLPEWEVPNMITKYYITTKGLEIAGQK